MSVKLTYEYKMPDGVPFISINEWAESKLTGDRLDAWLAAELRQRGLRQRWVDNGKLVLDDGNIHRWVDHESAAELENDPEWVEFFDQYIVENNITFNYIEINE